MAESVTGENSPDNVHMQTVSQGQSKCPWCMWSGNRASQRDTQVFSL